jgi:hypothetical protein
MDCCSKPALDTHTEISKAKEPLEKLANKADSDAENEAFTHGLAAGETDSKALDSSMPKVSEPLNTIAEISETQEPKEEESAEKADVEASTNAQAADETVSQPLDIFSPRVSEDNVKAAQAGKEDTVNEASANTQHDWTDSKALDSSAEGVSEPKAVEGAKVQRTGLGARIKTWLGCVKASAAEPKSRKSSKTAKAAKAPKATKTTKATKTADAAKTAQSKP